MLIGVLVGFVFCSSSRIFNTRRLLCLRVNSGTDDCRRADFASTCSTNTRNYDAERTKTVGVGESDGIAECIWPDAKSYAHRPESQ